MNEKELKIINEAVAVAIQTHVNGKIDRLHQILERQNEKTDTVAQQLSSHLEREAEYQKEIRAHIEEVRPFLQGAEGLKVVRSFLIWIASIALAWAAIKANLFKL